jgi:hypothetical protein
MEAGAGKQTFDARATAREQTCREADGTDNRARRTACDSWRPPDDADDSSGQPSVDRYAGPEPFAQCAADGSFA